MIDLFWIFGLAFVCQVQWIQVQTHSWDQPKYKFKILGVIMHKYFLVIKVLHRSRFKVCRNYSIDRLSLSIRLAEAMQHPLSEAIHQAQGPSLLMPGSWSSPWKQSYLWQEFPLGDTADQRLCSRVQVDLLTSFLCKEEGRPPLPPLIPRSMLWRGTHRSLLNRTLKLLGQKIRS